MSYIPPKSGQYDPATGTSSIDCVPAATAALVNRSTVDALHPTHTDIRRASGVSSRGLTYSEAADAALKWASSKGRQVILAPRYGLSRAAMRDILASGRAVALSIDTSVTRYTTRRTNYFVGNHTVYVQSYRYWPGGEVCPCERRVSTQHAEFLIDDPGTTSVGFLWWSADLAYRAAEKRTGGHGINVLVGPDTEGARWAGRLKGRIRSEPRTTSKDLGPIDIGHVYPGGRTEAGGQWSRGDGTYGKGWVHVQRPNGAWGWVNARRVRHA